MAVVVDDRPSFDDFFAEHARHVATIVALSTGDLGLAEDATQEAMARAHKRWSRVSRLERPDLWVIRVAGNSAIDSWRRRRREVRLSEVGDPREAPDQVRVLWVRWAMDQLTPEDRMLLILRHLHGLSIAEMGTSLAWRLVPPPAGGEGQGLVANPISTGRLVFADVALCDICQGPGSRRPQLSEYDPMRNTWTELPANPIGLGQTASTWTGSAIFSFSSDQVTILRSSLIASGSATAFDATQGWLPIATAPFGCNAPPTPVWTGHQVLMYCPGSASPSGAGHGGLALTVGS